MHLIESSKHVSDFSNNFKANFGISTPVNQLWDNITSELERAIDKFMRGSRNFHERGSNENGNF